MPYWKPPRHHDPNYGYELMSAAPSISVDELLALVAGTLNDDDFVRVAKAVKDDVALQAQLAGFEQIRSN